MNDRPHILPYSPREVVARVRALLRRARWSEAVTPADEPTLVIDDVALRATVRGQVLDLTPAEFRLLRTLAAHPGRVYSRNAVLDQLHTDGSFGHRSRGRQPCAQSAA